MAIPDRIVKGWASLAAVMIYSSILFTMTAALEPDTIIHESPYRGAEKVRELEALKAARCKVFTAKDALLVVDVQNDFMEQTPVYPNPLHPISESNLCSGEICSGALGVPGSSEIIAPINEWINAFSEAGSRVFASLDWHPLDHCSFCRNGTTASNPTHSHPKGAICGPQGKETENFDYTGKCTDEESNDAFETNTLMQWPNHCQQVGDAAFGSRFHPYLAVNPHFTVVKKGFDLTLDSYSAFGGVESKQGFPFDTEDDIESLKGQRDLKALIEEAGIERLFVVGLATDFCVLHTALDAVGKGQSNRSAPQGVKQVVMVQGAARGVIPALTSAALDQLAAAGVWLPTTASPDKTLEVVCEAGHPSTLHPPPKEEL